MYPGAQGRTVTRSAMQLELKPMAAQATVHEELEAIIECGHHNVDSPVVIKVGESGSPMQPSLLEVATGTFRNISESSTAHVAKQPIVLRIVDIQPAIRHEEVKQPIIIQIDEPAAPPAPWLAEMK